MQMLVATLVLSSTSVYFLFFTFGISLWLFKKELNFLWLSIVKRLSFLAVW